MSSSVELYLFSSGMLGLGGVEVPVPFFLIRHPQGDVIVDGGNPVAAQRDARAHWGELADIFTLTMREDEHCLPQLRQLGVEPASIRQIVQTHLHMDHTGALGHFPDATVLVHTRELETARAISTATGSGYIRADYDRPRIRWQPVDGDRDLFGDGSVRLIETPGHSAGHMSLVLVLEETGTVLLTADAADNRAQWEGRAHPRALHSREQAAASMQRLRSLARETDALIVHGHDTKDWARHRHAPDYYA
jgi:N-acyl homoserine lactone hydrolase